MKTIGYTACPCCGIDSMDNDLCAYCEEESCESDEHGDYWECNCDAKWTSRSIIISTPSDELDQYEEGYES